MVQSICRLSLWGHGRREARNLSRASRNLLRLVPPPRVRRTVLLGPLAASPRRPSSPRRLAIPASFNSDDSTLLGWACSTAPRPAPRVSAPFACYPGRLAMALPCVTCHTRPDCPTSRSSPRRQAHSRSNSCSWLALGLLALGGVANAAQYEPPGNQVLFGSWLDTASGESVPSPLQSKRNSLGSCRSGRDDAHCTAVHLDHRFLFNR